MVSGFARFPDQIVGGGSDEFFSFCLPWRPDFRVEPGMTPVNGPAVVPLDVATDAPLGRQTVTVTFSEGTGGSTAAAEDRVSLAADLEVTASAPPLRAAPAETPPCGLATAPPPGGVLTVSPRRVAAGGRVQVRLDSPPPALLPPSTASGIYVTCFAGRAAVSPAPTAETETEPDTPPSPLAATVDVPAGMPPGRQ